MSDNEKDYLEEEFLKCNIDDLPTPLKKIKVYENQVQEAMISGCSRQIAEYAILLYKEIEEKEEKEAKEKQEKYETLSLLKEEYYKYFNEIKQQIIKDVLNDYSNNNKNNDIEKMKLDEFYEETKEILEDYRIKNLDKDKEKKDYMENLIKFHCDKNKLKDKEERKKYINKKDAVNEFALRKIKKIVNDENEYDEFFQKYKIAQKNNK